MSQPEALTDQLLHVIARSPFHVYYEGPAEVLSAENKVGQFDILPGHADFFSVLEPGEIIITHKGTPTSFSITNGILTVRDNQVYLFADV
jgi:F0F1-type ATP synthase epsilon subunit